MFTDDDRRFLAGPRSGLLTVAPDPETWPVPVPVWFECTGATVQLFSLASAPKVQRVERTPYASLLAVNHLGEPEHWVSVAGPAHVDRTRWLRPRGPPGRAVLGSRRSRPRWTLRSWEQSADSLVRVVIEAEASPAVRLSCSGPGAAAGSR